MRAFTALSLLGLWSLGACAGPDDDEPGAVSLGEPARRPVRRLNRTEVGRTLQHLLLVEGDFTQQLPPDDASHGFDNAADALALSPLLIEGYELAAAGAVKEALRPPVSEPILTTVLPGDAVTFDLPGCGEAVDGAFGMWCAVNLAAEVEVPLAGTYTFTVEASAMLAGPELPTLTLEADGLAQSTVAVDAVIGTGTTTASVDVVLSAGRHTLSVQFDNDYFDTDTGDDRNVFVHRLTLAGPTPFEPFDNPAYDALIPCDLDEGGTGCAEQILRAFMPRAWRRPVTDAEIAGRVALYQTVVANDDSARWGVEMALRSVLTSPHFLFHVEQTPAAPGEQVSPTELASRLSYFLWSSMPDDELRALAADGSLTSPDVLAEQVTRMLADPKADALVDSFAAQWLGIRAVDDAFPDVWAFPDYTPALHASMIEQMRGFFRSFVGRDRSLRELLTAEEAWVDSELARFYGVELSDTPGFRDTFIAPYGRVGWLGQAGWLMAMSYPTRTSPVRRGVWVLGQLLCDEPDAPPPGVEGLDEEAAEATTLREVFEQHRAKPVCASCHDDIDPVGFAFEAFDGIGKVRTSDGGQPIDTTGELPDGRTFDGLIDLATVLSEDDRFTRCMVDRAFTYAHGRPPAEVEHDDIDAMHDTFLQGGTTLDALATAIVTSPSFLGSWEARVSRWNRWRGRGVSRRAFLGGSAAAVTLPWLASLQPGGARAADTPPVRLMWWYVPNGMHMPAFRPTAAGAGYDLPPILAPLGDLAAHTTVLSGLSNRGGEDSRAGDHARGTAAFLTCQRPTYEGVQLGQSIDQRVAEHIGHHTAFPSLQLGTEGGAPSGTCDSGYSCAYVRNISWAGPATPLPKQTSAQAVFDRLFAGLDAGLTEGERVRRKAYRTSVLDVVVDDATSLQSTLSVSDRHRVDEFLTGIRALEQRLVNEDTSCAPPGRPPARIDPESNIDLMSELSVIALSCDLTRVITFMLGNAGSNRNYGFIGASGAHHEISHHRDLPSNHDKLTTIGAWEVERFAVLLSLLRRTPEGEGSLLDHTLVMLGSEISDGNRHNHDNLPVLLAGSGGGAVSPGRHLVYDTERPIADLYISMAQAAGVPVSQFGLDGTGPLTELSG